MQSALARVHYHVGNFFARDKIQLTVHSRRFTDELAFAAADFQADGICITENFFKVEVILDGGKCSGGIESTVLDCTGEIPVVLRSGLITRDMIAKVVGDCGEYVLKEGEKARSPGMKYKHYSPNCKTMLFSYAECEKAVERYYKYNAEGTNTYILCDGQTANSINVDKVLNLGNSDYEIASNLYYMLREGERKAQMIIAVAPQKQDGVMAGVMNRLIKACKD